MTSAKSKPTRTTNVGLSTFVPQLVQQLDKYEARFGQVAPAITSNQKRRVNKQRKGAEKAIVTLAPIVEQFGLDSASLHSANMVARHNDAQTLVPLQKRLQKMLKRVDDEVFSAQSESWGMALQFYALLQRRAQNNGEIAGAIAPVATLFAYRHPKVKAAHATKIETRVKAKLQDALALAARHGIAIPEFHAAGAAPVTTSPGATSPATVHDPLTATVSVTPANAPVAPALPAAQPAVTPAPSNGATNGAAAAPPAHA